MNRSRALPAALQLVVVTDGRGDLGRIEARVSAALDSGPIALMLREPAWDQAFWDTACDRLRPRLTEAGGLLLANADAVAGQHLVTSGRVDGLHLAQRVVARWGGVGRARAALGAESWLGVSAHDERELAEAEPADYATLSPVFETPCKPGTRPLGAAKSREWSERAPVPVLWLGGIGPGTAPTAWAAGAVGVAVRGAAMSADSSVAAIRRPVRT